MGKAADLGARSAVVAIILLAGSAEAAGAATRAKSPRMERFHSCSNLVSYAQRNAVRTVGSAGVIPRFAFPVTMPVPFPDARQTPPAEGATPVAAPAAPSPAPQAGVDYSGTNVQEAGIDEPDIVKTDGKVIYAIAGNKLFAVAAGATGAPRVLGSLELDGFGHQLLLRGDRLLVVSDASLPVPVAEPRARAATSVPAFAPGREVTRIAEVDVSDAAAMRVVRSVRVDGTFVSGRQNGATARLVISSSPRAFDAIRPAPEPTAQARAQALRRNRGIVRRARLSGWVPVALSARRGSKRRILRPLVTCRRVLRPASFSGSGMLTVLTIDLAKGLPAVDSDGLMTDAQTVYSSADGLYVATQKWLAATDTSPRPADTITSINQFDVSDAGRTDYVATGTVPGYLLNQFSMSEFAGHLRVATTRGPSFGPGSESLVTVLRSQGGKLVQVGQVGGLGKGERIYAVRFVGDAGFVVTFRQVDPLYTLDLSAPARPRVAGELKLLGYSAYLHPAGGDLLIGVGRDATEEGRVAGVQVSLFDVSDLANPVRVAATALGSFGSSEAESDHHAFLFWPPSRLAVIPVQLSEKSGASFTGAIGFHIDRAGIAETGRVTHGGVPVRRSLVIGDRLYTVSDGQLVASRLDTMATVGTVGLRGS